MLRFICVIAVTLGICGLSFTEEAPQRVDWSAFVLVGDVIGEVVKIDKDGKGFTLRLESDNPKGGANNMRGMFGKNRNPRPQQPKGEGRQNYEDYQLAFSENGLVRWKTLPVKIDEAGKKVTYLPKELAELKLPLGAPGYATERSTLLPGHIVEVQIVRPKDIPANQAAIQDLRVKYAIIMGESPNGPPRVKKQK